MIRRLLIGCSLLSVLLLAAPSADAAKRRVPQGFFGMVFDGPIARAASPLVAAEFGNMASSGVESTRTQFVWADTERSRGVHDFSRMDTLVREAAVHGVSVLPVVNRAPRWARRYPRRTSSPPRRAADYAAFLSTLVGRYGPDGSFWAEEPTLPKRPIRAWQIWNEPNVSYQWYRPERQRFGKVAPAYGSLLRASRRALRRADPGAKVVLAGLTNASWTDLETLFRRGGIRRKFDVAAMNAYSRKAADLMLIAGALRKVLRRNGHGRTPLWVTEFTGPAAQGRIRVKPFQTPFITTDAGMATLLRSAYRAFATRGRRRLGIDRAYWYTWASSYRPGGDLSFFEFAGLRRYSGGAVTDRPALRTYRATARLYEGCRKTALGTCE